MAKKKPEYKIEKKTHYIVKTRYPFKDMEEGDSFVVPRTSGSTSSNIYISSQKFIKANKLDWEFTTKTERNKIRVWRINKTNADTECNVKVQKNIPFPTLRMRYPKYPFTTMQVGDSFSVKLKDVNAASTLLNCAKSYCRTFEFNWKFKTKTIGKRIRIWRTK